MMDNTEWLEKVPILSQAGVKLGDSDGALLDYAPPSSLNKAEVYREANTPFWKWTRRSLLYLFWMAFVTLLIVATVILIQAPWHYAKLAWWQRSAVFCLEPSSFMDSNGDGIGDIDGVLQQLDYLEVFKIHVLVLGPIQKTSVNGSFQNLTEIDPVYGTLEDFQRLATKAAEKGIRILLEIRDWDLNATNSTVPLSAGSLHGNLTGSSLLMDALKLWMSRGVSGFRLANTQEMLLKMAVEDWRVWRGEQQTGDSREEDTSALIISHQDGECEDLQARYVPGPGANASDTGLVVSCNLLGQGRNVSAQGVAVTVERATLWSEGIWPGWMVSDPETPQDEDVRRLLQVLLLTLPGTPFLESSAEPGLMAFHDLRLEKRSRFRLYKTLLAMRSKEPAFLHGDLLLLAHTTDTVAYLRHWTCSAFLVALNFGSQTQVADLHPTGFIPRAFVAVSSRLDRQGEVSLQEVVLDPREALVLKLTTAGNG